MNESCGVALKEWAAICAALHAGRQTILLRKGGLIESGDTFEVEHRRFWLYPTYLHQQDQGVVERERRFLDQAHADRPGKGLVQLSLFAEVQFACKILDETIAMSLGDLHCWTDETIQTRFHYRQPGLTLMLLRVLKSAPQIITETADQAGCRSWVPLVPPLSPRDLRDTLDESSRGEILSRCRTLVEPCE